MGIEIPAELDARLVRVADALFRRGSSLDRDDLRQLARETALVTLREKPTATPSYVLTAARWRILDLYRDDRRRACLPLDEVDGGVLDDFADELVERLDAIAAAELELEGVDLETLPEAQRVVVLLVAEGLTLREISERLGIPRGTVGSRASRARAALLARLAA